MQRCELKTFEILYKDDHLVAIHKPAGIHVHPTELAPGEQSCLPVLRDQVGQRVWPVHRLDRGTSGVLLFALDPDTMAKMSRKFRDREVEKHYIAVVRGHVPEKA